MIITKGLESRRHGRSIVIRSIETVSQLGSPCLTRCEARTVAGSLETVFASVGSPELYRKGCKMTSETIVGIDVSKRWLEVQVHGRAKSQKVGNDAEGHNG
jgi:hypothetical protein